MVFFKKKSNVDNSKEFISVDKQEVNVPVVENSEDMASEFLISTLSENLRKLIKKARKRGVVSRAMVEQASELDGLSLEEAEDALVRISEIGVEVKEEYDEGEELALGEEDSSSHDFEDDDEEDDDAGDDKLENNAAVREILTSSSSS